jgi:hypothetical protein
MNGCNEVALMTRDNIGEREEQGCPPVLRACFLDLPCGLRDAGQPLGGLSPAGQAQPILLTLC